jgi:DNA-binding transcriptional ArsR family regulator
MSSSLPQPDSEQIELPNVLAALGDETRLAIVGHLARIGTEGMICGQFHALTSKTNLTYHVGKLREAGVVTVTPEGTRRRIKLRQVDLDRRFPGFLDAIVASAADLPPLIHAEDEVA